MGLGKHLPVKPEVQPKHVACSSRARCVPQHIAEAAPRQLASGSGDQFVVGFLRIGALSVVLAFVAANAVGATNDTDPTVLPTETRHWSVSVSWENDTFAGTDQFYTDGVSLSVAHTGPSWMDPVANWLPWGKGRRTVGYNMAQGMYTPADTTLAIPDPNDRPYAGILSFGLTLHVERSNSYHGLKFITGVVGPWSLAEETQRAVHDLVGSGNPQGWDYQLENEPILNLAYEYRHKFRLAGRRDGWAVEALPTAAAGWATSSLQGQFGGQLRFGYNMPDDFGIALVRGMGHLPPPRRDEGAESRLELGVFHLRWRRRQSGAAGHHPRWEHLRGQPQR